MNYILTAILLGFLIVPETTARVVAAILLIILITHAIP